jgi:hypothetical protein
MKVFRRLGLFSEYKSRGSKENMRRSNRENIECMGSDTKGNTLGPPLIPLPLLPSLNP